ncbi:mucin-5AC isoform X2 [Anabrus simplex]|uniref:mucin-5AC isoform X2 n=1 Tax=Anabrus simplex TaxID=316456 RepID=UPI0035A366B7
MSCSDTKKSKKRKSNKSGNMGDVLGKECGDSEKEELQPETCGENVREEADGAPSGDERSSQSSGEAETFDTKRPDETKGDTGQSEVLSVIPVTAVQREEKPCNCEACKDRRELAAEQMEEMRRLQSYWMELRQHIRMVYRMAMEGRTPDSSSSEGNEADMKLLVHKLCARDPHQLFQRLESQVQEFVIEAKVRQLEILHREQQTPELAQIFLTGLLEGFDKLCLAAKQLAPLLQQLETEHLQRFNLTWEVLNKHLYQSCVYTDPLVQTNLPLYIGQLRNMLPGKNEAYSELVHHYLAFDDEMTLIGAMWRDTETLVHEYNQEQATLKAKQRMLREDWELFKAQRKLIQQKMWNKTASELREFDEQLMSLDSPREGSPDDGGPGFCLGCSSRRGCPCDECAMTHLLTCGGLITPPDSPGTLYNHKVDVVREYRVEGEGSEQPPASPSEPDLQPSVNAVDTEPLDLPTPQQQSCECHVCTAPLMTTMDLMESYECHTCVQQGVPLPGGSSSPNMNLHTGGFHLYPHIHGTGGGGDTGSLYPHLYNIHPSLLTQLGTKHSRLGVHLQDQLQLSGSEPKAQHLVSPPTSSVTDLIPLEALPPTSASPSLSTVANSSAGFSAPSPLRPKAAPSPSSPASSRSPASTQAQQPLPPTSPKQQQQDQQTTAQQPPQQQEQQPPPPPPASLQKSAAVKVLPAPCREHAGSMNGVTKLPNQQNTQSSASTQTSPNKALAQQKASSTVSRQLSQNVVKRVTPANQQQAVGVMNGHHHPAVNRSSPNLGSSSVRHSMTQTANSTTAGHGHNHSHTSLPDVVKSAATSTTPHRPPSSVSNKVAAHSCHKSLKNGGSMEPIKRVACADYPDSEVVDLEDSSSQDDTCSERSSSTTTSTQRDSRHCDCCYCEVFGHGMPSVAPVSRNYQEMRERLRLLLTKKKAKCKIGPGNNGPVPPGSIPSQPVSGPPPEVTATTAVAAPAATTAAAAAAATAVKPTVPVVAPSPAATAPVLIKQDSADSLPQPVKDPRDLEALLDFIEGNQSGRCKNAKKAAKKARQKQKKLEEKERRDQEEAERLRGLEALQTSTPEVTITVVNTPGGPTPSPTVGPVPPPPVACQGTTNKASKSAKRVAPPPAPAVTSNPSSNPAAPPQMVTIKRVMEPNGAEPTVTITLKGATPDKDKVLFTLVNGQVCQSQEESKPGNQQTSGQVPKTGGNNNPSNSSNSKKKKNSKGNVSSQQNNVSTNNKSNHSSAKNVAKNSATLPNSKVASKPVPLQTSQVNSVLPAEVPATASRVPPASRSFSLENLKLPPGITITKVDGPTAAAQKKAQLKAAENPKPPVSITPTNASTTIIAAPTTMGSNNRLPGYGQAVNGSNVIVVDTGRMKDELETNGAPTKDHSEVNGQNSSGNGKKKNKKKGKNGNESGLSNGVNPSKPVQRQQQMMNSCHLNGKQQQQHHIVGNKNQQNSGNLRPQSAPQQQQQVSKPNGRPATSNSLAQSAIIKVNGSMVTIRNPALQQAMASARYPPPVAMQLNGQGEVQELGGKGNHSKKASPGTNGLVSMKGKENSNTTPPRFTDSSLLRNRQMECNGGIIMRGNNSLPPRMRPLQQQAPKMVQNSNNVHQNHSHETSLQHPNAARAVIQAQTAVREAMAAVNDAKKKKKKKKGAGGQGHADDWTLVESVFAPKDIDLENGDIDDDERELEAFKRFCFNSVPPKRKEKVHLNIKDIVLKKKSSAIGCS